MLKKNDKIKMIKAIPGYEVLLGQTFEIQGIEDGVINFRHENWGQGNMTEAEFKEHFVVIGENGKEIHIEEPTSKWTKWMKCSSFEYKTDNKKRVVVRSNDGYQSKSSCEPGDEFNLKNGLDLCLARIEMKRAKDNYNKVNELLEKAEARLDKANDRLDEVLWEL